MTLKSIIRTISNDKILSILVIFSVILLCTLLYYNLNEKLLNYNSHTLEHFEEEDDGCDIIRELEETPEEFETYEMKDTNGTIYKYLIISKSLKNEQIINYMNTYIKTYIDKLNSTFPFDSISECIFTKSENISYQRIKDIIVNMIGYSNNNTFKSTVDEYKDNINNALGEYNSSNDTNNGKTKTPETNFYKYRYITKIYKIILKILFKNKINNDINNINRIIDKYRSNPKNWRKRRIRNNVNYLHRVAMTLGFINDDANFESKITSNLLSNYTILDGGIERRLSNDTVETETNVFDYFSNDDVDSPLYNYIQNNNQIFKNTINSNTGMMDDLNTIYNTTDFGYYHVFESSNSIIKTYYSDDYDACYELIDYESDSALAETNDNNTN